MILANFHGFYIATTVSAEYFKYFQCGMKEDLEEVDNLTR